MKMKDTEKVYAMKILNKWEMLKRAEVKYDIISERFFRLRSDTIYVHLWRHSLTDFPMFWMSLHIKDFPRPNLGPNIGSYFSNLDFKNFPKQRQSFPISHQVFYFGENFIKSDQK